MKFNAKTGEWITKDGPSLCSFGDDEPSGTQQVVQSSEPWSVQKQALIPGFEGALDYLNTPKQFFPNDSTVPFSNQSEQALGMLENRATAGSPVTQAAQGQIQNTINGDYLNAGNPAFQGMLDQVGQQIRPNIDATFAGANRNGSGLHQKAYADAMADAGTRMAYQNYGDERGRQMQASSMAPGMAQQDYADIGQLMNAGGIREQKAGEQLADSMNRFDFGQNEFGGRLANYMGLVGGGQYGGTKTSEQPIYNNTGAGLLGGGLAGAQIAGSIFGKDSPWATGIGAGIGGLLGGF